MERIVSAIETTGQGKGLVSDVFKTRNRTGTIRNHGKTSVLIAACAEIRKEFHAFQCVVGGVVANAAGRHANRKTHTIDIVFDSETEECRSC